MTNASSGSTTQVADLVDGPSSSNPRDAVVFRGEVHFVAEGKSGSREIWKTDGTESGTVPVSAIRTDGDADVDDLTIVEVSPGETALYFTADDGTIGNELHRYLPGASSEFQSWDLEPGATGSFPDELQATEDGLIAFAAGPSGARRLFLGDGDETVTFNSAAAGNGIDQVQAAANGVYVSTRGTGVGQLELFDPITRTFSVVFDSFAFDLTRVGDLLVFDGRADPADGGIEPWVTNGEVSGTQQLLDANPGEASSVVTVYRDLGADFAVIAVDIDDVRRLYRSDGTTGGTTRLFDPALGAVELAVGVTATDVILFGASTAGSSSGSANLGLWGSDGAPDGAELIDRINNTTASSDPTAFLRSMGARSSLPTRCSVRRSTSSTQWPTRRRSFATSSPDPRRLGHFR